MVSCVAFGCKNSRERGVTSNVHYHRFPFSNPSLLAKWTSVIGFTPRKQSVLCSDHFTPRDYKNLVSGNLKDTAVPSKFKRLPSLRIKLSGVKETIDQDVPKAKPQPGRRSASQPTKDNSESPKKRKKDEKKRQPVKRKREKEEPEEDEEDRSMEASPEYDPKLEKIETSSNSEENPSADCSASKSSGIEETVEPPDTAILLLIKAEETPSGASAKQTKPATKRPPRKKPTPGEPKKSRSRKILRLSSDESEGELEAMCAAAEQRATASNVQMDSGEVLAAVRVELDENELSDNGQQQQPVNVFKKWTDNGTGFRVATKFDALKSVLSSRQKASSEEQQKRPLCTVPADMDHVVAVNERRTRYRYIYRVGQCFPEEDDDAPFITSKLNFVVNALQSQNDKVLALEKRCRELSRSNSTLKDILGIPDNEEQVEAEEVDPQQEAYLIIGTLPSTSASLPLYRFTLTDRSPTVIAQANDCAQANGK